MMLPHLNARDWLIGSALAVAWFLYGLRILAR